MDDGLPLWSLKRQNCQRPWSFNFCSSSHPRGTFGSTNLDVLKYIRLVGVENFFERGQKKRIAVSTVQTFFKYEVVSESRFPVVGFPWISRV